MSDVIVIVTSVFKTVVFYINIYKCRKIVIIQEQLGFIM